MKRINRILAMALVLIMALTLTVPAFAATPDYSADIRRLDGYGAFAGLDISRPNDTYCTQKTAVAMLENMYPDYDLGLQWRANATVTMRWLCDTTVAAAKAMNIEAWWNKGVTNEELTQARAVHIICLWLDFDSRLTDNIGTHCGKFTDVPKGAYYYDAVKWALANGITSGTSTTRFSPDANTTQAQVLTFIWRQAGSPSSRYECPFVDVQKGSYCYTALCWAAEKGLITGTDDGHNPESLVCTRAMAITYLWRQAGSPKVRSSYADFDDIPGTASYRDAVAWAVKAGITNGTGARTFSPGGDVTRGQIVTMMWRAAGSPRQ